MIKFIPDYSTKIVLGFFIFPVLCILTLSTIKLVELFDSDDLQPGVETVDYVTRTYISPDSCEYWVVYSKRGDMELVHKRTCIYHQRKHCAFCHSSF